MTRERTATRRRKGWIGTVTANGRRYWRAVLTVGGRRFAKDSKDRAVCEEWLADMVAAHPTYVQDTNRPKAMETWRLKNGRRWTRHIIAVETNPHTANLHFHVRHDWPLPRRVITIDEMNESIPIAWLHDDNGGEGYTLRTARERVSQLPPMENAAYTIRRMDTTRYVRIWDR